MDSGDLFKGATEGPKIALIAGRTPDNPKFFRQAIAAGATHILLEKPGAPTVGELEAMAAEAKAAGVPVYMGFIKNISSRRARAGETSADGRGAAAGVPRGSSEGTGRGAAAWGAAWIFRTGARS